MFAPNDRIRLEHMPDDPDPIPSGTTGTVLSVVEGYKPNEYILSVRWDNGRSLSVVTPPDVVTVLKP